MLEVDNAISCPRCGSANVECIDEPNHDHRCHDCGLTTLPCAICAHADRTGSWVDAPDFDGMTHCRECHGSWPRATEWQHCTVCHRTFTNIAAADMHRVGGQCVDPATVVGPKSGKPKLKRSERQLSPRTTVELWAQAGESPYRQRQSASEGVPGGLGAGKGSEALGGPQDAGRVRDRRGLRRRRGVPDRRPR